MEEKGENEKIVEDVAEELNVKLANTDGPLGIKLIALIILVGGLSILGNLFTDVFGVDIGFTKSILRTITGLVAIIISYGLVKKSRLSLWLFGIITIITLFVKTSVAIYLIAVFIYLFYNRGHLDKSFIDLYFEKLYQQKKGVIEE